eukprot:g50250.t1
MGRRRKGKAKKPVDEDEEEEEEVVEEQEAPPKKKKVVIQEALPPTKKKKAPVASPRKSNRQAAAALAKAKAAKEEEDEEEEDEDEEEDEKEKREEQREDANNKAKVRKEEEQKVGDQRKKASEPPIASKTCSSSSSSSSPSSKSAKSTPSRKLQKWKYRVRMRRNGGRKAKPKPPNRREQVEAAASEVRGLTHYKEDWNAEVRAVSSYYSEELSTEEKAKRRDLSMFVKYHIIPKVVGPVDKASPFPGWTLFAGPDDDPDDEDFYQDEVVAEEERAEEYKQAGEMGKSFTVDEYPEVSFAFEKRHDRRSLLRLLQKVWYHMSQVVAKPKRASSAAEQRALQVREDAGEEGEAQVMPILKNRNGVPFYWMCACPPPKCWRQLNVPGCARCQSKRPCDEHGAVSRPFHGTGLVPCAKAGCENKLKLHDQFCCKCGAVAPKNLLEAAAGLGPRVWDAEPPLDPAWDREWKVEPVQQNDHLFYYETVTTAPDKDDGLVALYCVVLAAPEQKYRSEKGKYKVPWFQVVVEVMEMRISKELPTDFQVRGVTPEPEVARAWDGNKSPGANHKLAVDRVSIPELIIRDLVFQALIMLFNIATYRENIYYKAQDRVWTDDEEEEDEEAAAANELSAWDKGKMWLLPHVPDLHLVQFLGNSGFACQRTPKLGFKIL